MGMGEKGVGIGFTFRVCVKILPTAKVILLRGKGLVSSNRLEKLGIEPTALVYRANCIHYTTASNVTNLSENGLKGSMLIYRLDL